MNIKEHIDQEHYPIRDTAGRSVLKTCNGRTVVICATDGPDGHELVGWYSGGHGESETVSSWDVYGHGFENNLLGPPPPKVKVEAWAIVMRDGTILRLREDPPSGVATGVEVLVKLSGEIEGEWA